MKCLRVGWRGWRGRREGERGTERKREREREREKEREKEIEREREKVSKRESERERDGERERRRERMCVRERARERERTVLVFLPEKPGTTKGKDKQVDSKAYVQSYTQRESEHSPLELICVRLELEGQPRVLRP